MFEEVRVRIQCVALYLWAGINLHNYIYTYYTGFSFGCIFDDYGLWICD